MMRALTLFRGMSCLVAHLVVRPDRGSHPTERWQDKSRKLRRGRVAEELRCIKYILRGATEPLGLSICTTHCDITTTCTSRTLAS
jgi:hypothetical protein